MKSPWRHMKNWWLERKKPRRIVVHVMRETDMLRAHLDTDFTHVCRQCGERVGIYPSTVTLMQKYQNVVLICNRCQEYPILHPLVPGAEQEIRESKWRVK